MPTPTADTYIDVRGPWPVLFIGFRAYVLRDVPPIPVAEALDLLDLYLLDQDLN